MKQHEDSIRILCPCCGKRMFDAKQGIKGFISIKCDRCKRVATFTFKNNDNQGANSRTA